MRTRAAKVDHSTSTQPAPNTPTSTARLPPEVIAHIQALAEEEETPSEITKLRASFELVNKEWHNIVDCFTHIVVTKVSDVTRLTTKLPSSKLRELLTAKTRSISIGLGKFDNAQAVNKLLTLLKWLSKTDSIVIEDVRRSTLLEEHRGPSTLARALAGLGNVRHFRLSTKPGRRFASSSAYIAILRALATAWPKLETFALDNLQVHDFSSANEGDPVFDQCPSLRVVVLEGRASWPALSGIVAGLPASVHTLHLATDDPHNQTPTASAVLDRLGVLAPQLRDFGLTGTGYFIRPGRGLLDELCSKLVAVERLTIDPHSVTNLADALAPLPLLTTLRLKEVYDSTNTMCEAGEVAALLGRSSSLESVAICRTLHTKWTAEEQGQIASAAGVKGIDLVCE